MKVDSLARYQPSATGWAIEVLENQSDEALEPPKCLPEAPSSIDRATVS